MYIKYFLLFYLLHLLDLEVHSTFCLNSSCFQSDDRQNQSALWVERVNYRREYGNGRRPL